MPGPARLGLALLPFALLLAVYLTVSTARIRANPQEKLMPGIGKMASAMHKAAFVKDKRTGDYLLWRDTAASLKRLGVGMAISAVFGLMLGLNMGLLPVVRGVAGAFVTFVANIPPLALLPILFIALGVGEVSKVALIFIGTAPLITRDIFLASRQIPNEMIVKSLTLGAGTLGVIYRVALPQILPRLINTVRLSMGAAWLFLIAAEAIAADTGMGYRIFLVRRYLAMDTIIPYVMWITLLAFVIDSVLKLLVVRLFPWYTGAEQ